MPSNWWYVTALGTVLEAAAMSFMYAVAPGSTAEPVGNTIALALLLGYLLVPIGVLLDVRTLRESTPWRPSGWRWGAVSLLPLLNASAGAAYCVRRLAADRGTVPGERWRAIVAGGAIAWTIACAIEVAVDHVRLPVIDPYLFDPLLFAGVFVTPVAVYLDAARVRGYAPWTPNAAAWAVGAGVPYLGALVAAGYLIRRRRAFADVTDQMSLTLPDAEMTATRRSSPWFRGAAGLFAVHVLVVVALAAGTSISGAAIEVAALLLWLPFGPFFAGCVFMDARWRRERGWEVGDSWYLYLASVVVQAAAFWYLLRRVTKYGGARSGPVGDTESG